MRIRRESCWISVTIYREVIGTLLSQPRRPDLQLLYAVCASESGSSKPKGTYMRMRIMLVVKIHVVAHLVVCSFWEIDLLAGQSKRQKSTAISKLRSKKDIKFHFIKEQVENGVIELYFVNTKYQLADNFSKSLCRERIEFLINKLGMRSFTPETLKQSADEAEE
ncbi:hypothetical protein Tco_1108297 [Tanacetum coccineum]